MVALPNAHDPVPPIELRDYFAIHLAAAWLKTYAVDRHPVLYHPEGNDPREFALLAYDLADVMLEARQATLPREGSRVRSKPREKAKA